MADQTDETIQRLLEALLITATETVGTEVVLNGDFQQNQKLILQTQLDVYVGYFECACDGTSFVCNAEVLNQALTASSTEPYWH